MLISIRTLLASIIIVIGIVSATIAFVPVYYSALSGVEDVVSSLRVELAQRIQGAVTGFFNSCQQDVSALMLAARLDAMDSAVPFSAIKWLGSISMLLSGLPVYLGLQNGQFIFTAAMNAVNPNISFSYTAHGDPTKTQTNDTRYAGRFNVSSGTNISVITTRANTYDPTKRPWYPPLYAAQSWSSVYLDNSGLYSVLTAGGPFVNSSGHKLGAFAVDFPTSNVVTYLQQQKVGLTGRVLLIDRASMGFLGGNWPVSSVVNNSGVLRMARLADIAPSDALVELLYQRIGETSLLSCAVPCTWTIRRGSAAVDAVYVDVLSVADSYGLDMRLIQVLPARDYLAEIDRDSKTSIGATAGAVIGLLVLAVFLGHVALSPLAVLEEMLYLASTLSDEVVEPAMCNFLSEIVAIEEAFTNLQAELKRVKSFVPRSVLQRLEDGDDGEDEGALKGEGSTSQADSSKRGSMPSTAPGGDARRPSKAGMLVAADGRSVASRSSQARSTRGGRVLHGLNVASGLATRQVTLMMVNLCGFHEIAALRGPPGCEAAIGEYLSVIESSACSSVFRGVLDSFSGDHVVISFNASNSVASHLSRCAGAICALEAAIAKRNAKDGGAAAGGRKDAPMRVRIAAATGKSFVGNIGSEAIKRFTVVGGVVNQCCVLLQLCKMWNVNNLVSASAMEVMEYEYVTQPVGVARLPPAAISAANDTRPTSLAVPYVPVGTVVAPKNVGDDEWMYQLSAGGNSEDDGKNLRAAFTLLATARNAGTSQADTLAKAQSFLDQVKNASTPGAVRLREELAKPSGSAALGPYYDSVVGIGDAMSSHA